MSMDSGGVTLRYYGHSAFRWTTPYGVKILIDPFSNPPLEQCKWFLQEFPLVHADLVFVSHPHFDHKAFERVLGDPTIIRTPGKFIGEDFTVEAVPDQHARDYGRQFNHFNLIFVVRIAGISFCHLGDNRAELPVEVLEQIGSVDVLMVPVDASNHLLTYEEVDAIIELLNPKVVIPMHYFIPGLTNPDSTLMTADFWIDNQRMVRRFACEEIRIYLDILHDKRKVLFFEEYAKK